MTGQRIKTPFLIVLLSVMSYTSALAADSSIVRDTMNREVRQTMITDRALAFTGFGVRGESSATLSESAVTRTIADTIVPYLAQDTASKSMWEVTFPSLSIDSRSKCSRMTMCTVWLDSLTGGLIQARLVTEDTMASSQLPGAGYWEKVLKHSGYAYHGQVKAPPSNTLLDALHAHMFSHPCQGQEIIVWCLLLSTSGSEPTPYWCIVGRGVPFRSLHEGKGAPSWDGVLTNYLSVINAETGEPATFERVR